MKRTAGVGIVTRSLKANESAELKAIKSELNELRQMFSEFMTKASQPTVHWIQEPAKSSSNDEPGQQILTGEITLPIEGNPSTSSGQAPQQVSTPHQVNLPQQVQLQHINIMAPPKFDGNSSEAISWLIDYREVACINKWSDDDSLNHVRQSLTNAAKAWYRSLWFESKPKNWAEFEQEFKTAFLRNDASDSLRARLRRLKQTRDMDVMTYYYKTMELCTMVDRRMSERDRIDQVIDNLLPEVRSAIRMKDPSTIIELQRAMKLWVADHPQNPASNQPDKVRKPYDEKRSQGQNKQRSARSQEDNWCLNCGKKGHFTRGCSEPFRPEVISRRREEWRTNPPFKNRMANSQGPTGKANALKTEETNNSESAQISADQNLKENIKYEEPQLGSVHHSIYNLSRPDVVKPHVKRKRPSTITCKVNGKTVDAIVDTGATLTVVPYQLVKDTNTPLHKWQGNNLGLANGTTQQPLGWCEVSVEFEGRTYTINAVVLRNAPDILLGDNYITKSGVIIAYPDNVITYTDKYMLLAARYLDRVKPKDTRTIETQTGDDQQQDNAALQGSTEIKQSDAYYVEYVEEPIQVGEVSIGSVTEATSLKGRVVKASCDLLVPPRSRARVDSKITGVESQQPLLIEPEPHSLLLAIPGISRRTRHVIDVINISEETIQVYRGDILARASTLESNSDQEITEQKIDLSPEQEQQVQNLLAEYDGIFVTQNENIGIVPFIKHVIDTGDAKPIRSKPYRVSFKEQQVIRNLVDEMLDAGVIRPSRSHWASPVVLVKKKGTTDLRFCVDYRKLNQVTKVDPYPIPNMEAVLETLSGNHWFSKLDIKSMYWQVLMDEEDRQKTAFVVHCGHYEFNVMPFGLVAAPMTAMRVMNEVVKDLESNSFVFYDDILVYTPTFESHLLVLKQLFDKLKKANITLNKKKCELLMKSVTYLGHVVTPKGILPDPEKIKSISAFKRPTNITEARSFIGMCNFFRRYIRGFSIIAKPIHDTIKEKQTFIWTDQAQKAMEELKQKLTSAPLLVHYDQEGQPIIRCDASGYGLGAVLLQKSNDPAKDGVVAYTSRTLIKSERNYATTHKECLAMIHAIKQWRYYLYGKHFQVITDHHALCWLMKTKDHQGQLARWSLLLQEFQFTVHYESGKVHDDADCLSRYPLPATEGAEEEYEIPTWPISAISRRDRVEKLIANHELVVPTFDVAKEQRYDVKFEPIMTILENPSASNKEKRKLKHYLLKEGQLYRRSKRNKNIYLLVIPESMKKFVLQQAHDAPSSGHFGIKRTIETLRSRFYWPTLDQDVKQYVKTCDKCQLKKADSRPREGLMVPMPIPVQPFEIVGMDLLGPLPMSSSKKNHILVITDYLTKFVIASPMRKTTTARIADHLKRLLFFKHGIPKTVVTDNGANLTSYEMRKLLELLKITHKTTSPYRPQTNGQTERYNRVIGSQLAIFCSEKQQEWDHYLDALVFAYNTSRHASHLQTPFYLVHGREARKLLDLVADQPTQNMGVDDGLTDEDVLNEARRFAKNLIEASQLKAKERYDSSRVVSNYKVGDLVLKKKQLNQIKESRKFNFPYYGPFKIIRRLNEVNVQIALVEDETEQHVVHVSQIKPYHSRDNDNPREGDNDSDESELDEERLLEEANENIRIPSSLIGRPWTQ
uniref:RNA-directed DNA polymerase n=1 Tax=Aceria tosichella TaxID=561515 RepID=A0A6G1SFF7_9ACAR